MSNSVAVVGREVQDVEAFGPARTNLAPPPDTDHGNVTLSLPRCAMNFIHALIFKIVLFMRAAFYYTLESLR